MKASTRTLTIFAGLGLLGLVLAGCGTAQPRAPLPLAERVDLPRFMGEWFVIGSIPTVFERGAHNAVERYTLGPDGVVGIDFRYRKDAFEGEEKRMTSRGFVDPADPSVWGVQFLWPFKADYRVAYLSPDYRTTIIAREKRDYVWIMARTPALPKDLYDSLLQRVAELGYDPATVQLVPQRPR